MTWDEAKQLVRAGHRARLPEWKRGSEVKKLRGFIIRVGFRGPNRQQWFYTPNKECQRREDWELV